MYTHFEKIAMIRLINISITPLGHAYMYLVTILKNCLTSEFQSH